MNANIYICQKDCVRTLRTNPPCWQGKRRTSSHHTSIIHIAQLPILRRRCYPRLCKSHALLDLSNRQRRVQPLGAGPAAVQDGVATVQAHAVVESVLALRRLLVSAVGDPAVGLQQHGGSKVLLAVPPVGWARCAAAGAQDALVQTVQLAAVGL